jgi:hypothetical protein
LRNEIRNPTPDNVADPLDVLQGILGATLKTKTATGDTEGDAGRPAELVEDIDFKGLSLQDFIQQSNGSGNERAPDVHSYTVQSIEECMSPFIFCSYISSCACR